MNDLNIISREIGSVLQHRNVEFNKFRIENKEKNDCSVIALCLGTGHTYEECHGVLKKLGRKDRRGAVDSIIEKSFEEMGYILTEITPYLSNVRTLSSWGNYNFNRSCKFLIYTSDHCCIAHGSNILCPEKKTRKRIVNIFLINAKFWLE